MTWANKLPNRLRFLVAKFYQRPIHISTPCCSTKIQSLALNSQKYYYNSKRLLLNIKKKFRKIKLYNVIPGIEFDIYLIKSKHQVYSEIKWWVCL